MWHHNTNSELIWRFSLKLCSSICNFMIQLFISDIVIQTWLFISFLIPFYFIIIFSIRLSIYCYLLQSFLFFSDYFNSSWHLDFGGLGCVGKCTLLQLLLVPTVRGFCQIIWVLTRQSFCIWNILICSGVLPRPILFQNVSQQRF